MKTLILVLFISLAFPGIENPLPEKSRKIESNLSQQIDDGWYTAKVGYYNNSTFTRATYSLDVKVEYNSVTAIDFGNGGSVHSGYNNSGYTYYGGSLYMEKNYQGQIVAATTKVTVSDSDGTRSYDIRIE
jgi:hypothetical protein